MAYPPQVVYHAGANLRMVMGHIHENLRHIYTTRALSMTADLLSNMAPMKQWQTHSAPVALNSNNLFAREISREILGENVVRQLLLRPRTFVVSIAVIAAVLIVGAIAASIYIFGAGGGNPATAHGTVTVPTLAPTDGNSVVFTIDGSSSKATFTIVEVLFGKPNTVVGATNQVAGQILVNQQDPSKSQLGEIKVDLSALITDNPLRTRTLQGRILETDTPANQYGTFVAKSITGLPSSIAAGQQVSFKITGDLTIHQVTKTVTFDAKVTMVSAHQLTGQAQATVKYGDFNIAIPDVPSVTGVGDTVILTLTFTANAS